MLSCQLLKASLHFKFLLLNRCYLALNHGQT